jgi:hypothetical protein
MLTGKRAEIPHILRSNTLKVPSGYLAAGRLCLHLSFPASAQVPFLSDSLSLPTFPTSSHLTLSTISISAAPAHAEAF